MQQKMDQDVRGVRPHKTSLVFERPIAPDPDVFLRKSKKKAEDLKKACTDSTESEKSDDEDPLDMTKSSSSTPWSLKRKLYCIIFFRHNLHVY